MTAHHSRGPRLFVSDARLSYLDPLPRSLTLDPEQSHHISHVLRLKRGDQIELGDRFGEVIGQATIIQIGAQVSVEISSYTKQTTDTDRSITLLCALCKGDKNELIIDWATELGCHAIHLWQSPRSVMRLKDQRDISHKTERYAKIALAAAQQSRQPKPPTLTISSTLKEALLKLKDTTRPQARLLCSLTPMATPIQSACAKLSSDTEIILVVGPEGDLDPSEELLLTSEESFIPITLGKATLRSELAAVSAIAAVKHLAPF
jgi:16S rRNA (uracil1498-N3)-methyltransferase